MKISICDDDKSLRLSLRKVLERALQLKGLDYEINEQDSGESLLRSLVNGEPDLLFLDIEMGGINGMDAARELRKTYRNTVIIFVTAFPDFVFQGYEVHAFHYILKPYKEEKILEVLYKALREAGLTEERYYVVEQKSQTIRLPLSDILYFQSDRKKIVAVLADSQTEFYGKLSNVEDELPDFFVRIHNRCLANLKFISRIETSGCICGGIELPVSRGYKQQLMVAFAKLMLH